MVDVGDETTYDWDHSMGVFRNRGSGISNSENCGG
jgi:hypothetical protein